MPRTGYVLPEDFFEAVLTILPEPSPGIDPWILRSAISDDSGAQTPRGKEAMDELHGETCCSP
jgi:hypothetical protein